MKMPNMCPFEKRHFLTWIDLNSGFGRNWDTFLKKSTNGTFKALQMWTQNFPNSMQGIKSANLAISNLALLIPCMGFEIFWVQIPSLSKLNSILKSTPCLIMTHFQLFAWFGKILLVKKILEKSKLFILDTFGSKTNSQWSNWIWTRSSWKNFRSI